MGLLNAIEILRNLLLDTCLSPGAEAEQLNIFEKNSCTKKDGFLRLTSLSIALTKQTVGPHHMKV